MLGNLGCPPGPSTGSELVQFQPVSSSSEKALKSDSTWRSGANSTPSWGAEIDSLVQPAPGSRFARYWLVKGAERGAPKGREEGWGIRSRERALWLRRPRPRLTTAVIT